MGSFGVGAADVGRMADGVGTTVTNLHVAGCYAHGGHTPRRATGLGRNRFLTVSKRHISPFLLDAAIMD